MAFKFVVFAAALAYANAGLLSAPAIATYSAAPAVSTSYINSAPLLARASPILSAYGSPLAIGATQQNVIRGLGGAISTYSKAVDSAYSSVRKYDTRITNNALSVAPVWGGAYGASPLVSAYGASPLVSAYGASPLLGQAPLLARTASLGYSPAAVVSHASYSGLGASYAW